LGVLSYESEEALSQPFSVNLTLVAAPDIDVDPATLIGQTSTLSLQLGDGTARFFNGIVARVKSWEEGTADDRRRYGVTVVPSLWKLGHVRHSRIFQGKSVPDIVKKVLDDGAVKQRAALSSSYAVREYCVQYNESDLEFVHRLLAEEGIFYFFEHEQDHHTLVLGDAPSSCQPVPGEERIAFREPSKMAPGEEHVDAFSERLEVRPGAVSLRDFNYMTPTVDLTAKATAGGDVTLEIYEYPGRYGDGAVGSKRAKVRLEAERVSAATAEGSSLSRRLLPGHVFELDEHPVSGLNGKYLLVEVRSRGSQAAVLARALAGPGSDREGFRNQFTCLREGVPFRPPPAPRPIIPGPQTAIVVGPGGEEIFCDAQGRIKVQFHWDREGGANDKSSCWIRVSQAWAGPGWGALYLPRIGQEVVVEFLEGDPDRPVVVGSVYNGANPPPLSLPGEKTKSTLRSASSPGSDGANELRFEDAKGNEEVYLHAQKDLQIHVENDKIQKVGGNEKLTVEKDRSRTVNGDQALQVTKNDSTTIGGNQSLQVTQDRNTTVQGSHTESIGGSQSVTVGAMQSLSVGGAASESIGAAKTVAVGAAFSLTVGGAMTEVVGGTKSESAGGKSETIGGDKKESVGGTRTMSVGDDYTQSVEKGQTLKVGKDFILNVAGKLQHEVKKEYTLKAKEITLDAEDKFLLKVGSATIELKKGGDVVIKGADIKVNASGDVVLMGSKISQN
jgi:type VI secretion system secreted protein VgrG